MPKRLISIALLIALCAAAAAFALPKLKSRADALTSSRNTLREIAETPRDADTCVDEERIRFLLVQLSHVDAHSPYWLLSPLLRNPDATRDNALAVVGDGLRQAIVPDLVCRLSQRARQVASSSNEESAKEAPEFDLAIQPGAQISGYVQSIVSLETNLARFRRLGVYSSGEDNKRNMDDFYQLEEYADGSPLSSPVRQAVDALSAEITDGNYWKGLRLPYGLEQHYAERIKKLSTRLRLRLNEEIDVGYHLLARMNGNREAANAAQRDQWISWIEGAWLHSDASHNPCETIRSTLQEDIGTLISQYAYPESFGESLNALSADRCYRPLMARLSSMRVPPYGPIVVHGKDGTPQINPALLGELKTQAK